MVDRVSFPKVRKNWYPRFEENVGPRGGIIQSDEHLRRICEEKGLVSQHLENTPRYGRVRKAIPKNSRQAFEEGWERVFGREKGAQDVG